MVRLATGARERIVAATLTLLREGGLSAAGLNDVVARARAPKGSLYHYFPAGKAQMVAEALGVYRDSVAEQLRQDLRGRAGLDRRVVRLFDSVAQRMGDGRFGQSCAVGAVVLDLQPEDDDLRRLCDAVLAHWADTVAENLHELPAARRAPAGRLLVNLLEGAQLAARAAGHARPLQEAAKAFVRYAQALSRD
jgi:TetR/AcrR family transcriptional regulator, lmrAB and yxaGH operons repressor